MVIIGKLLFKVGEEILGGVGKGMYMNGMYVKGMYMEGVYFMGK